MSKSSKSEKFEENSASDGMGSKALAAVQGALSWSYDAALNGLPGMGTLDEFTRDYYNGKPDVEDTVALERAIESLIAWQMGKAGTAGFITGLGGMITLPAAIPANLAAVLYIQLRMIAAIAKLRGYDIHSDQVKSLCIACLAGSAVSDILKDVGIQLGTKLTQQAIMKITGSTIVQINKSVGFRLITKSGSTGILNLSKMVPFLGGIIGGTFDTLMTGQIASASKAVFVTRHN